MQQGSACPLAVMYIRLQGRRQSDHGLSSLRFLMLTCGSVAPDALKITPSSLGDSFGSLQNLFLLPGGVFKQC